MGMWLGIQFHWLIRLACGGSVFWVVVLPKLELDSWEQAQLDR